MPRRDFIAIEAMMRYEPAAHYDSGEDGIFSECRSCRFHRPYAADQTCVFRTCPYGSRSYTVFAVINKRESDWDASAADFASDADYQAFLDRVQDWSLYDTGVHVSTDDHILTLITCDRDYHSDDGQLVVMAVQN